MLKKCITRHCISQPSKKTKDGDSKSQNGTLDGTMNCSLDEIALLKFLQDNPEATQTDK